MSESNAVEAQELLEKWEQRRVAKQPAAAAVSVHDVLKAESARKPVINVCTTCGQKIETDNPFVRIYAGQCGPCREAQAKREEEDRLATARREREASILDLLHAAGPNVAEHRDATLASFDASEAGAIPVAAARDFVAATVNSRAYDPVRGLYLWGGTGTGKTHIAVGIIRELLCEPRVKASDVLYDHAAELMARIQDTYGTGTSTMELLERRFKARIWVLDDLGTERASDDIARHLTLIFTKRALRPTVVTSNLAPEQFERRRPELVRVVSRLGPAYFRAVEVKGRDRRFD